MHSIRAAVSAYKIRPPEGEAGDGEDASSPLGTTQTREIISRITASFHTGPSGVSCTVPSLVLGHRDGSESHVNKTPNRVSHPDSHKENFLLSAPMPAEMQFSK